MREFLRTLRRWSFVDLIGQRTSMFFLIDFGIFIFDIIQMAHRFNFDLENWWFIIWIIFVACLVFSCIINTVFESGIVQESIRFIWRPNMIGLLLELPISDGFPQVFNFLLKDLRVIIIIWYFCFEFILFVDFLPVLDFLNNELFLLYHMAQLLLISVHFLHVLVGLGNGCNLSKHLLMFLWIDMRILFYQFSLVQ